MSSGPLVTIALACYNQENFLGPALDSILADDYDNFHLLVADDASTDRTVEIARDYEGRYPGKITVIAHPKNLGVTRNVLSMRPHYRGKYVVFFAGDDLFLPGKLTRQVAALEADPEAILAYHDLDVFESESGRSLYRFNEPGPGMKPLSGTHVVEELLTRRCFIGGASVMVRWDRTQDVVHRPEIKRVCDWVYFMEVAHRGKVVYIPEPLVRYRRHSGNMTSITDIADELKAYDIIEAEYPMYRDAAEMGRARLELSYFFRYALARRFGDAFRTAGSLFRRMLRHPANIPGLLKGMWELLAQRAHLLHRSGSVAR